MKRRPSDLNDDPESAFYLSINPNLKSDSVIWYSRQNMGKNKIGRLMSDMCKIAGIQGRKVNHSARRTTINTLLHDGVPATTVMQITAHKNVHSVNEYGSASEEQQKDMSKKLSALHTENSTTVTDLNDEDDQTLLSASQEIEDTLQNINNFENLMSTFDINLPEDTAVVELPNQQVVPATTTTNVAIAVPTTTPSVVDIPLPLNMNTSCSNSTSAATNWFTGASINAGITINVYNADIQKKCRKKTETSPCYIRL